MHFYLDVTHHLQVRKCLCENSREIIKGAVSNNHQRGVRKIGGGLISLYKSIGMAY